MCSIFQYIKATTRQKGRSITFDAMSVCICRPKQSTICHLPHHVMVVYVVHHNVRHCLLSMDQFRFIFWICTIQLPNVFRHLPYLSPFLSVSVRVAYWLNRSFGFFVGKISKQKKNSNNKFTCKPIKCWVILNLFVLFSFEKLKDHQNNWDNQFFYVFNFHFQLVSSFLFYQLYPCLPLN